MFEKVNPKHPDKIADRIAGAIVDLAYSQKEDPKIAVEVLIGHGECNIIIECDHDLNINKDNVKPIVDRITECDLLLNLNIVDQDPHLAENQKNEIRCGDNGIFKGCPITTEQQSLTTIAKILYNNYNSDGKYILDSNKLIICQSNAGEELRENIYLASNFFLNPMMKKINPLGSWTGGLQVDSGATNRKLGSDMGDAVTGGGIHGKDLSKADVTVNIYLHLLADKLGHEISSSCAIGDKMLTIKHNNQILSAIEFKKMIKKVKRYIKEIGGFEALAEWGLIRPNIY